MKEKIRFWTYANGVVRITLQAGQTLRHWSGGPTDEGYNSESNVWSFDGYVVTNEWSTDGRDCDGRQTQHGVSQCRVRDVAAGNEDFGVRYPLWQQVSSGQRDYAAEAMNY